MKRIDTLKKRIAVAKGEAAPDLALKNAKVFCSFTGEFVKRDIVIADGVIAGVGEYPTARGVDLTGKYVTPGLIDGHIHIESSMLAPAEFARAVLPLGTTAVIADPHEIANVAGLDGIRYMLEATENIGLSVYFMLPSCVPSSALETSGAILRARDLAEYIDHPRVLGIGEMMNFPGVLAGERDILEKIALGEGKRVDGHAPGLGGNALSAYAAAGIRSDHECIAPEEARERLRQGMHIMLREGSAAKNLRALLPIVDAHTAPFCFFAADDRQPADLLAEGHINHMVRQAIAAGIPVATALQMATMHPARYFGLRDRGAVAPGYRADLLVFGDLATWRPEAVYTGGRLTAEQGRIVREIPDCNENAIAGSVKIKRLDLDCFKILAKGTKANAIEAIPEQIVTKAAQIDLTVRNGEAVADPAKDLVKAVVFERHHTTGSYAAAFVHGLGLRRGAIASTVAHDAHNLIVIGVNDADMLAAARALERVGGGLAVVADGEVRALLPLEIGGLMSRRSAAETAKKLEELKHAAYALGIKSCYDPFGLLAFLSLPVIPERKLTDRGLVDTKNAVFISPVK